MTDKPLVRVALPWLQDALRDAHGHGTLPAVQELRWLAGRGNPVRADDGEWRRWLLHGMDGSLARELVRWQAGACLAAVAGAGSGRASAWAVAQPVHLAAGLDHVRMAPLAEAMPSPAEAEQLAATLREHFQGDALELADFVHGAWLVRCEQPVDSVSYDPAAVAGHNVHDFLPSGPGGARVRSLMNEVQMVLHEHPVNDRRVRTRQLPINALWIWGFGRLEGPPPRHAAVDRWQLRTDDLWLRSFWQLLGGQESPLGLAGLGEANTLVSMTQLPTPDVAESLAEVDSSLLARLRRGLQSGELGGVDLLAGQRAYALDGWSRFRFWRGSADVDELRA